MLRAGIVKIASTSDYYTLSRRLYDMGCSLGLLSDKLGIISVYVPEGLDIEAVEGVEYVEWDRYISTDFRGI